MLKSESTCSYNFSNSSSEKIPCKHLRYKNHECCVFHCPDVEMKKKDFDKEFKRLIYGYKKNEIIDFQGFVFPGISFIEKIFNNEIYFNECQFIGDVDFSGCQFSENAYFNGCQFTKNSGFNGSLFNELVSFSGSQFIGDTHFRTSQFSKYAYFNGCQFSKNAYFNRSQFTESVDFNGCQFTESVDFNGCQFTQNADFNRSQFTQNADFNRSQFTKNADFSGCQFTKNADFSGCQFIKDAYFNQCKFTGNAYFDKTTFIQISDFVAAQFHGVIFLDKSYIRLLKPCNQNEAIDIKNASFDGAIIEEANLWGITSLENYSFKNSFILSFSFAEREIKNCDFTGAVFEAVRTRGWKPDKETLVKTKYIYTDYTVSIVIDSKTGKEIKKYEPVETSRVPIADGIFGEGEYVNFTIADYLKEYYKWTRAINIPVPIRTAVINYIQFFIDFCRVTESINIELHTKKEGDKIRVEFLSENKIEKDIIEKRFFEYIRNVEKEDLENLNVIFSEHSTATNIEKELLMIDYKNQIRTLKADVDNKKMMIGYFQQSQKFMQNLINQLIINNPNTVIIEQINDSQIQVDTKNSNQTINNGLEKIGELISFIKKIENDPEISENIKQEISNVIDPVEKELLKTKPEIGIIKESLNTLRNIFEGFAGSLIASNAYDKAIPFINKIIANL